MYCVFILFWSFMSGTNCRRGMLWNLVEIIDRWPWSFALYWYYCTCIEIYKCWTVLTVNRVNYYFVDHRKEREHGLGSGSPWRTDRLHVCDSTWRHNFPGASQDLSRTHAPRAFSTRTMTSRSYRAARMVVQRTTTTTSTAASSSRRMTTESRRTLLRGVVATTVPQWLMTNSGVAGMEHERRGNRATAFVQSSYGYPINLFDDDSTLPNSQEEEEKNRSRLPPIVLGPGEDDDDGG